VATSLTQNAPGVKGRAVGQRTSEIGVRMAIGAAVGVVQGMILFQAVRRGIAGAAVGLGIAGVVSPLISRLVEDRPGRGSGHGGAPRGRGTDGGLAAGAPRRPDPTDVGPQGGLNTSRTGLNRCVSEVKIN